ncbi:prolyl oligopeptidase-like protein [Rhexocercosporidium sp. MPI-PUGE-AT-0058]|nr:prolyl oligopeptidase-like protein [Rhexocercosporidium sp. MPI-PUGE-AT-0058]
MTTNSKIADPKSGSKSSSYHSQNLTVADLSVLEKLDMLPAIISTLASTVLSLFTGVWKAKDRRPQSYYRFVALTGLRRFVERTTTRQQHFVSPPTDDAYELVCKRRGQTPKSEILTDGTRAHWIGSSGAENIVLNFHGGGFVLPASEFMVEFMFQVVETLNKKGKNAACLFLAYDLAPGALYPRQLQQASALINHLTQTLKISPQNIILTGDSAGANLALSLLSHITHPHPDASIPRVSLPDNTPFRGLVLISPWISFDTTLPSFTENAFKDCVSQPGGKKWSGAFLGCVWPHDGAKDNYNEALRAPAEWWAGLPVKDVCVLCGSEEVLRDGIVEFEAKLRRGVGSEVGVEMTVVRGEYHDQPNIDLQLGYKEKDEGETARLVKSWIASKL